MIRFRHLCFFLIGSMALISPLAMAQTEEANTILGETGPGVVALVSYGADKAEILKGSGFALGQDVVVTAYHVVSQAFDVEGLNVKGKKVKFDGLVGVDKAHDIALLKLKGKLPALRVGSAEGLAQGARLFVLGTNAQGEVAIVDGTFRRMIDLGPAGKIMEVQVTAPDEYRGGPLVDAQGQLVGMLIVGDRSFKFGLPISALVSVPRAGAASAFKSQTRENYFDTVEGNDFAGRAAIAMDEPLTARLHLEKVVKLKPTDIGAVLLLADVYGKQRDYAAAAAAYRNATQLDPKRAEAFYGLGSILLKQTQYKDAADALEKAAALGSTSKDVQMQLGGAYEAVPDFAKAAAAYEKYISLGPADAWAAQLRLGFCRTHLGQFDAAIAALLEAEKAQPKDLKVRETLADAYVKAGRLEDAEAVYAEMAGLDPANAQGYFTRAYQMYDGAGKFDKAVVPLKKIIELNPKNETNYYFLGMTYFRAQQYDQAVAAFEQALAVKPDFPHAWYQIGSSYFNAKKYKEAAEAYKKYVALAPDDATGWLNIGVAYNQAKAYEAALEPLKKCLNLKPDDSVALANLTIVYINLKDMYAAKEIFNRLQAVDPAMAEKLRKYIR